MKKMTLIILMSTVFYSCKTIDVDKNKTINQYQDIEQEINGDYEIKSSVIEKEKEDSFEIYDLTVLKGKSYPVINNDTPFTVTELEILNREEGIEFKADVITAHYFKYFLRDKKELLQQWINSSAQYIGYIEKRIKEENLPLELMYLPFLESGYNVNAYSRVGAGGVWQFMPATAKSYGLEVSAWSDERRNPYLLTDVAIKHLLYLYNLYGDWYLTLAAYNAGQGRLNGIIKEEKTTDFFSLYNSNLPTETKRYIPQFNAIVKIMKNLDVLNFHSPPVVYTPITTVTANAGLDLNTLTRSVDVTWSQFKRYNNHIIRQISNPFKTTDIVVPVTMKQSVEKVIKSMKPVLSRDNYTYYTVKSGDSLWYLSNISNSSINQIKKINNLKSSYLYIGQKLLLPGITMSKKEVEYQKPNSNLQTYIIKSGDTISSISIRYNIKLSALYRENNLNAHSILKIGQIIRLPGYIKQNNTNTRYYTVVDGDSIWLIAQRNNIPYKTLLTLNNMNSSSKLSIGDRIKLY